MTMNRFRMALIGSAALSALAAAAGAQPMHCATFDDLALNLQYGCCSCPGGGVSDTTNGVDFCTLPFQWDNGQFTNGGFAEVDPDSFVAPPLPRELEVNNVNMRVDMADFATALGGPVRWVQIRYSELGGNVNFRVNSGPLHNVANFPMIPSPVAPGVDYIVGLHTIELRGTGRSCGSRTSVRGWRRPRPCRAT